MKKFLTLPAAWQSHDKEVKRYLWSHRIFSWSRSLLGLALLVYLLGWGKAQAWNLALSESVHSPLLVWLFYFGILGMGWEILTLPFSAAHHAIERLYQLSKQGYGGWFVDKLKGWALALVLGAVVLLILYFCTRYLGNLWWVVACTLFVLLSIVLAQLTPVLLIPLFFKLKPMEAGPLKERLFKLCERFQVKVEEIYHLGLGEKTEKGNAAFVGLGKTKRIIIGDTLYEKFSPDEVEAVFAHELGHQVHNDLWMGIGIAAGFMYLTFFVAQWISNGFVYPHFGTTVKEPFGLLLFFIVLGIIQIPIGVIQTNFTRWREKLADEFAHKKIGTGEKLAEALEKLTIQNRGQFYPNPIMEFLTHSHPAPWRRIYRLTGKI